MIKAFLSYSHDSDEHIAWVERLATSLQAIGLDVLLDRWHLNFGQDVNQFMEASIAEADIVLVVCTPAYITKSNSRRGGVGYESVIISSELSADQQSIKFIPILRSSNSLPRLPAFLGNRLYVDMTEEDGFGRHYALLINQLQKFQTNALLLTQSTHESDHDRTQLILDGPHWVANQGNIPKDIFKLMGITTQGLINVEVEDFVELFGIDGFWHTSATTTETIPNYEILARHAAIQIEAANVKAHSIHALNIAISAPMTVKLSDIDTILSHFENLTSGNATILLTSVFQQTGARISLAFQ